MTANVISGGPISDGKTIAFYCMLIIMTAFGVTGSSVGFRGMCILAFYQFFVLITIFVFFTKGDLAT